MHVLTHELVKTYPPGVRALDGLSIAVGRGEIFGLVGPNGAGKSTTIKILTTLARHDSGTAVVAGHDVRRHPDRVRRAIGVVAQRSGTDAMATGRDNLTLQGRLFGLGGRDLRRRVGDVLDRFDLTEVADRAVRTYSGGTQRRLDIALGMVHRPQVLFLDEPSTGLDPQARSLLWRQVRQLCDDGVTILLTTHYLEEADRLARHLAIIDKGRLVVAGTPDALKGELRGDAIHVELHDGQDERLVRNAVERLAGVREISLRGRRLSARSDDGAAAVPGVLAALGRAGVPVATVTVARPSLDDVYLRHVGHRFTESPTDVSPERIHRSSVKETQ